MYKTILYIYSGQCCCCLLFCMLYMYVQNMYDIMIYVGMLPFRELN